MAKVGKKKGEKTSTPPVNISEENENEGKSIQSIRTKASKGERRAKKLISTLGLKPVEDVHKIIVKKSAKMAFAIVNAEVYKINGTDSYVIFGDARSDDLSNPLNSLVSDQLKDVKVDPDVLAAAAEALAEGSGKLKGSKKDGLIQELKNNIATEEKEKIGEDEDQEEKTKNKMKVEKERENAREASEGQQKTEVKDDSEVTVDPDDVQLVISQTGSTEEEVIAHLKKNKNDIVQTIIELSK